MRLIGLTGGIASGKSTVGRLLAEQHGATVIDADQVSRDIMQPGSPTLLAVLDALGHHLADDAGVLDRAALRAHIIADADARRTLEGITHPAIRTTILERIQQAVQTGAELIVVEAALLVETGSYRQYPELWVVTCDPVTQLERLTGRDGMDEPSARALIATQAPLADKEAVATTVIRNDGSLQDLERAVRDAVCA